MVNQASKFRSSYLAATKYQYGFEVPKDYQHVVRLDEKAGNTKWQDSTKLEMAQLVDDYDTFKDYGHSGRKPPNGYKNIIVHLIFTVKHDGRHKSRLVADGHLTDVPVDSVYSGVVSLRGLRLLVFLAELNGLDTWATDIGNMALSFHRVREAIAAKIIGFYHVDGVLNPTDILSKHWGYQQVWKLLRPSLLF
jgi:hypothetical protein